MHLYCAVLDIVFRFLLEYYYYFQRSVYHSVTSNLTRFFEVGRYEPTMTSEPRSNTNELNLFMAVN